MHSNASSSVADEKRPLCHDPDHTPRWGMVVDVNRCVGCQTCTIACKHWNNTLPDVQWRRVIDVEDGEFPNVQRHFLVVGCQHCAEPPCVPVCPTGATRQRADGLVTMDYEKCIGCAYCAVACPYQARTIAHEIEGYYTNEITQQEERVFDLDRVGVAQKCTFCMDRIDDGLARGLTPGVDPDATPACSAACIAQAIRFGDFKDPASPVSQLVGDNPNFQMHAELGADPQIKYLYSTPAVPGRDGSRDQLCSDSGGDPQSPLLGQQQAFWDWRAAMNWIFGGISSGFLVWLWVLSLDGSFSPLAHAWANFAGGGLMAIGLAFVFWKIGRKERFWRAVARPQTSWMTRELYVVVVFGAAVLIGLVWQHSLIFAVAGLAAVAFLICQAMILRRARGIPAWRHPVVPALVLASGLHEGIGLLCLVLIGAGLSGSGDVGIGAATLIGALAALACFALWRAYEATARQFGVGARASNVLQDAGRKLVPAGQITPAVLFVMAYLLSDTTVGIVAAVIAGVLAIAGGAYWKFTMITQAGHHQGFAMAKLPQRGSGTRAAPVRLG